MCFQVDSTRQMLIVRRLRRRADSGFGRVPEWLKGTGCKPVGFGLRRFESYPFHQGLGSLLGERRKGAEVEPGGCSSMVELQPSKLATRVRFPSPAPELRPWARPAVEAMVPLANMFGYVNSLRSFTQGRASYSMQFSHYDEVPANVADEVKAKLA